jgi:hypothetical protein
MHVRRIFVVRARQLENLIKDNEIFKKKKDKDE